MHSSRSVIYTIIERIRSYLDDQDTKYDNAYVVRNVLMPEMLNAWSRLQLSATNPILVRFPLTITAGTRYYTLPPNVGEIWGAFQWDDNDFVTDEWRPRSSLDIFGPGWRIEGNMIVVEPAHQGADEIWNFLYMPTGDFLLHYSNDGYVGLDGSSSSSSSSSADLLNVTLSSNPTVGLLDTRANAYVGALLRILQTHDGVTSLVEEHLISAHDPVTNVVTLRTPILNYADADRIRYEVVPMGLQALAQTVSALGAINLGVSKSITQKQMLFLQNEYKRAFKTVVDNVSNMNQRLPKHYDRKTMFRSSDMGGLGFWYLG